jgi:hypothetical protein
VTSYYVEIEMPGLRWSGGAPEPFLIGGEHRTMFAFIPPDDDFTQSEIGEETYRVAEFTRCVSVRFGFPNDEVRGPFLTRGLALYGVNEAVGSPWLEEMRAVERQHLRSAARPFPGARHWVLTFHDSTLEALADGIEVHGDFIGRCGAIAAMTTLAELT